MKIASLLLGILDLLLLGVALVSLLPTFMIFDAPGSTEKKSLWFVFWVFMLFPPVTLISAIACFWKWSQGDYQTALKAGGVAPAYAVFAFVCLFTILDK